ncbi:MAG: hypothetical protein WCX62_05045, partial [Synergistaceae bacterium]
MTDKNNYGTYSKKVSDNKRLIIIVAAAVIMLAAIGIYSRREAIFSPDSNGNGKQAAAVKIETVKADKTV